MSPPLQGRLKNDPCYTVCVVWCVNLELQKQVSPFLSFLRDRFKAKINPEEYYLAYSGGKDSHFLLWFIKEYIQDDSIQIVGVNTSFEIPEIRERIMRNCDVVLHPAKHRNEIKEKYGIPCFSKQQDEYIYRYQRGNRSENTMNAVLGRGRLFVLNKTARELLLSGKLHRVSNKCCYYNKELPMIRYGRSAGRKAIIGTRASESKTRKAQYTSCLKANGDFIPLYDISDALMDAIYEAYGIEIPKIYDHLSRTGCGGCPYTWNCQKELTLLPDIQRKKAIEYFKESYDVKKIQYTL